jgi:hypothetical protein
MSESTNLVVHYIVPSYSSRTVSKIQERRIVSGDIDGRKWKIHGRSKKDGVVLVDRFKLFCHYKITLKTLSKRPYNVKKKLQTLLSRLS